jgi:hypothetical protein
MKLCISCLYLLLSLNSLFAQNAIKGTLLDKQTNKGIDLVSINIKASMKGSYSCIDGKFELERINNKDSIAFHHISFHDKVIAYSDFPKNGIIYLSPVLNELQEVNIYHGSKKEYKLISKKNLFSNHSFYAFRGSEVARLIKDTTLDGACLKEFLFYTKKIELDNYVMRIHLYENNNGVPGKEIVINTNKYYLRKGSKKHKINIYDNYINFPKEGLFCGLEWLGVETRKGVIEQMYKYKELIPRVLYKYGGAEDITFTSSFSRRKWEEDTKAFNLQSLKWFLGLTLIK